MEPGDILYIPPGFPHEGYSLESSLNYSVGFRAPSAREMVSGFADYVLSRELGGRRYSDPNLELREHPAEIQQHELDGLRNMMLDLVSNPEHFNSWLGEFISQSRHELDLAPPEPPYQAGEIHELLESGETLQRLGGLKVLRIGDRCYVNGEAMVTDQLAAVDALTRHTIVTRELLGEALDDPSFLALLAALINSGYWYFND